MSPRETDRSPHTTPSTDRPTQVMEASLLNHSISFEVVGSDPGLPFICCKVGEGGGGPMERTSMNSTQSPRAHSAIHHPPQRITNNTMYVNYTTEFSNDASADVVLDSQYKKKEALVSLQALFANAATGATA